MKKFSSKKYLLLIFVALFLFFPIISLALQLDYPEINIPGIGKITLSLDTPLNALIAYIYYFILTIAGIATFVMLVWGGVRYLTSAGNPTVIGEAKDRIFKALLGLVIILASFLILNTINPELVHFKPLKIEKAGPFSGLLDIFIPDNKIILYDEPDFQIAGKGFLEIGMDNPVSDLKDFNFDDVASSVKLGKNVDHAILCRNTDYQMCGHFGTTDELPKALEGGIAMNNRASSALAARAYDEAPCQGVTLFHDSKREGRSMFFSYTATPTSQYKLSDHEYENVTGRASPNEKVTSFSIQGACKVRFYKNEGCDSNEPWIEFIASGDSDCKEKSDTNNAICTCESDYNCVESLKKYKCSGGPTDGVWRNGHEYEKGGDRDLYPRERLERFEYYFSDLDELPIREAELTLVVLNDGSMVEFSLPLLNKISTCGGPISGTYPSELSVLAEMVRKFHNLFEIGDWEEIGKMLSKDSGLTKYLRDEYFLEYFPELEKPIQRIEIYGAKETSYDLDGEKSFGFRIYYLIYFQDGEYLDFDLAFIKKHGEWKLNTEFFY